MGVVMEQGQARRPLRTETDCGETETEGKAKEPEPGLKEEGGVAEVFVGEVQQLSFLRQGHMGLVSPLVTCRWVGDGRRRKRRQAKEGTNPTSGG